MKRGKATWRPDKSGDKKNTNSGLAFSYDIDETGAILGTHPRGGLGDNPVDPVLGPFRKPTKPLFIDTPEKKAMWDSYWDNVVGWWEGERAHEKRAWWR
jgi:hypothetical protein